MAFRMERMNRGSQTRSRRAARMIRMIRMIEWVFIILDGFPLTLGKYTHPRSKKCRDGLNVTVATGKNVGMGKKFGFLIIFARGRKYG